MFLWYLLELILNNMVHCLHTMVKVNICMSKFCWKNYAWQIGIFGYFRKFFPACFYWCFGSYYTGPLILGTLLCLWYWSRYSTHPAIYAIDTMSIYMKFNCWKSLSLWNGSCVNINFSCLLFDIKGNFHAIIVHLWIETTSATVWMKLHEPWPLQWRQIDHLHGGFSFTCYSMFVVVIFSTVKPANTNTPWDHRKNPVFTVCRCVKTKGFVRMENCWRHVNMLSRLKLS